MTRDRLQRALRILTGAFGYCPDGPFQLIVARVYQANVDERECTEVLARASSTVPSWTRESNAYQRVVRSAPEYPVLEKNARLVFVFSWPIYYVVFTPGNK